MSKEQDIVDVCFECGILLHQKPELFVGMDQAQVALWIARQLANSGILTTPVGGSYGVICP